MKGITVTLYEKTQTGTDAFGKEIFEETPAEVKNVLVAPVSVGEALEALNLSGKKIVYNLGIPKGDNRTWTACRVNFFGKDWKVCGEQEGIEELVPTAWHKKVTVERYE